MAAKNGHLSIIEFLVNQGVSINSKNIDGQTALNYASTERHQNIVEFLTRQGAQTNGAIF